MNRDLARLSGGRRPAVIFADDNEWSCFFQLAAEIHKAGFATIRVTTSTPRRRWATAFRAFFDHTVVVPADASDPDLSALTELAGKYAIVDIQATETLAELIYGFAADLQAPHCAHRWSTRLAITDKVGVSNLLSDAGVLVPPILLAAEVTPAHAVDRLGLPLVVKERVGYGGAGVHVAETVGELERLLASSCEQERFYETFETGAAVAYGGLAVDDGTLVASSAYAVLARSAPTAPPARIERIDAPEVDAIAAAVVAASGLVGLFSLNLIRDSSGRYWLHDINPRSFGSMSACTQMGATFGQAYVRWVGGEDPQPPSDTRTGPGTVVVFPDALRGPRRGAYTPAAVGRWMVHQYKVAGAGYVAVEMIRNRPFPRRPAARPS